MADLDASGTPMTNAPKASGNDGVSVIERTTLPKAEQETRTSSPLVEMRPTVSGNEMVVLVQVLSSINRNLAFIARTLSDFTTKDEKK